ncbi:selenocysteine-specific elongation factor-like [Tubulanus polymorphus]|uniref:selenocysteine-specific elongation factor-like n=1 Tax=Tubulanus polymorphus TaxID=672921 RepID=UPI003DA39758
MGVLNFNLGVLGHVDSGKTSLVKSLSTIASTACFDKNPQSKERGITLDLGFSSFLVDIPAHLEQAAASDGYDKLQFTLVDCPGHASLIKTIIGGAQIIDMMILVVDIVKGVQTQTAECLVIGEICCEKMIVVINKIDLIPEQKRQATIDKMTKRLRKTLESTKFADAPIIPVSAKPGGPEVPGDDEESIGIEKLIETMKRFTFNPNRSSGGRFVFAVDHCFSIKGVGTVMTGTAHSGSIAVGDNIEIPSMKVVKKAKSIQMFKQPIASIKQGDRAGICVTQFDPRLLERGLVCSPGSLPTIHAAIVSVRKIPYFKGSINTKSKFHITLGHETAMGRLYFFGSADEELSHETKFNFDVEYKYQDGLIDVASKSSEDNELDQFKPKIQYVLIELERAVTCAYDCLVIGSRLDTDIHLNTCRLAFHGRLLVAITDADYRRSVLPTLRIYKNKSREGVVERIHDEYTVIGRSLFKKESNLNAFIGLKVSLSTGERGVIEAGFGQSGKFKVRIPDGVNADTQKRFTAKKKGKAPGADADVPPGSEPVKILLNFKRYVYDPQKTMIQI